MAKTVYPAPRSMLFVSRAICAGCMRDVNPHARRGVWVYDWGGEAWHRACLVKRQKTMMERGVA
jgi:hypothetical protein